MVSAAEQREGDGLARAIAAAGGVGALARALGIAQPSVSQWSRIPAERVLAVEALTGVPRTSLRPDLYPHESANDDAPAIDEVEQARARLYRLLGSLLRRAPDEALLGQLASLRGDATPIGMALIDLGEEARRARADKVDAEYFALFVGVGRGEILPYASYYMTGFLNERPLARLRTDLAALGIERAPGDFEPEDHLGTLFDIVAGLADGTFPAEPQQASALFARHIEPWADRCLADVERAASARFYKPVARLGRVLVGLDAEAFAMGA